MSISGSYFGLHMQDPVPDWTMAYVHAYNQGRRFRLLKSFHPEDYRTLQSASPGTEFIFRPWIDDHSQGDWIEQAGQGAAEADAAADDYIGRFKDSVNQYMASGYVESLNEEYPTRNSEKLRKAIAFDRAFIRRLRVHCPHVRPVVFCAAVGNPDHHEYQDLVQMASETAAVGGAFGYHGYWTVAVTEGRRVSFVSDADVRRDLHMRWNVIDEYFVSQGVRVKWMIGESGATKGDSNGYNPDVIEGWKAPGCWNGDEEGYLSDIALHDLYLADTRAVRENRLIGVVLFTSRPGDGGVWHYFNVTGSMMWKLARYVAETEPADAPAPPPDPEPDPVPESVLPADERENLWAVSVAEQIRRGISLNPNAKLQSAILGDLFVPVLSEGRHTSPDGRRWAWQPAERVAGDRPRRIYGCEVIIGRSNAFYGPVFAFEADGSLVERPPGDESPGYGLVLPPVGTEEERLSGQVWPGDWQDANPYGNQYTLRGRIVFHTGADLNLNSPTWNADRGSPVYACAGGEVTYAGRFNEAWGNMVIIYHHARGGFFSRSAHLAEIHVQSGDVLRAGQQIGTIGGADVGLPDHLHFDISETDVLGRNPGDWPGSDRGRLTRDYTDPKAFLLSLSEAFLYDLSKKDGE